MANEILQIDPRTITVTPEGDLLIDDNLLMKVVNRSNTQSVHGLSSNALCENAGTCGGTNTGCKNTGDCHESTNYTECHRSVIGIE